MASSARDRKSRRPPNDRVILKQVCLPLKELAEELGTGYSNVRNWSSGAKEIPEKHRKPLAAFMRKHAKRVARLADELER